MIRAAAAAVLALAFAARAHGPAGGIPAPPFEPPPPGTYALPPIQPAPEAEVVDGRGRARPLSDFTRGRITLLGLVYTRCADPEGCPRATWAFSAVRARLRERPALEAQVRMVTLSFDPAHDDWRTLGAYARRMGAARAGCEWQFLTTRSRAALEPILEGFGQDLRVVAGSRERPGSQAFAHTLKVFLIDPAGRVREIYATAYLEPAMIVNDLETLALGR